MQAQRRCARARDAGVRDAGARKRFKSDERIIRALIRGGLMRWESKRPKNWHLHHRSILVEKSPHCAEFWRMIGR